MDHEINWKLIRHRLAAECSKLLCTVSPRKEEIWAIYGEGERWIFDTDVVKDLILDEKKCNSDFWIIWIINFLSIFFLNIIFYDV